jgi:hypothetical protein
MVKNAKGCEKTELEGDRLEDYRGTVYDYPRDIGDLSAAGRPARLPAKRLLQADVK